MGLPIANEDLWFSHFLVVRAYVSFSRGTCVCSSKLIISECCFEVSCFAKSLTFFAQGGFFLFLICSRNFLVSHGSGKPFVTENNQKMDVYCCFLSINCRFSFTDRNNHLIEIALSRLSIRESDCCANPEQRWIDNHFQEQGFISNHWQERIFNF